MKINKVKQTPCISGLHTKSKSLMDYVEFDYIFGHPLQFVDPNTKIIDSADHYKKGRFSAKMALFFLSFEIVISCSQET